MIYIGIDPGAAGGFAFLNEHGDVVHTQKMPATERELLELLDEGFIDGQRRGQRVVASRAVLEHVWSTPGQGGAFAFGKNVGLCLMALTAARVPFDQVLPRTWQKALGIRYPKGATDTKKKNITKRRAEQLWPLQTITHAIADALLMAEYCRRSSLNGQTSHQAQGGHDGEEGKGRSAQGHTEARGKGHEEGGALCSKCGWNGEAIARRSSSRSKAAARKGSTAAGDGGVPGPRTRAARERRRRREARSS